MENKNNLFKRELGKEQLVIMERNHTRALIYLVLALALIPVAYAATLGEILRPIIDVFGPEGLLIFRQYPFLFDSIISLIIFVGLTNRILGERFGKPVAIGLGIALAVSFVVGTSIYNFSLMNMWPFALVVVFGMVTYFLYTFLTGFGSNKFAAFATAYVLVYFFVINAFPGIGDVPVLKQIFSWLGLLAGVCTIGMIMGLIGFVRRFGGSSSSSGSGIGGGLFGGSRVASDERDARSMRDLTRDLERRMSRAKSEAEEEEREAAADDGTLGEAERTTKTTADESGTGASELDSEAAQADAELARVSDGVEKLDETTKQVNSLTPEQRTSQMPIANQTIKEEREKIVNSFRKYSDRISTSILSAKNLKLNEKLKIPPSLNNNSKTITSLLQEAETVKRISQAVKSIHEKEGSIIQLEQKMRELPTTQQSANTLSLMLSRIKQFNVHEADETVATLSNLVGEMQNLKNDWDRIHDDIEQENKLKDEIISDFETLKNDLRRDSDAIISMFSTGDTKNIEDARKSLQKTRNSIYNKRLELRTLRETQIKTAQKISELRERRKQSLLTRRSVREKVNQLMRTGLVEEINAEALLHADAVYRTIIEYQFSSENLKLLDKDVLLTDEDVRKSLRKINELIRGLISEPLNNIQTLIKNSPQIQGAGEQGPESILISVNQAIASTLNDWGRKLTEIANNNLKVKELGKNGGS